MAGYNLWGEEPKRKPVKVSVRKKLRKAQSGRCHKCHKLFSSMGVRPIAHHVNLNPKQSTKRNVILVCPNCHDKIHQKQKKVRKRVRSGGFGLTPEYRVVKVGVKRKRRGVKPKKKRKRSSGGLFGSSLSSSWRI